MNVHYFRPELFGKPTKPREADFAAEKLQQNARAELFQEVPSSLQAAVDSFQLFQRVPFPCFHVSPSNFVALNSTWQFAGLCDQIRSCAGCEVFATPVTLLTGFVWARRSQHLWPELAWSATSEPLVSQNLLHNSFDARPLRSDFAYRRCAFVPRLPVTLAICAKYRLKSFLWASLFLLHANLAVLCIFQSVTSPKLINFSFGHLIRPYAAFGAQTDRFRTLSLTCSLKL